MKRKTVTIIGAVAAVAAIGGAGVAMASTGAPETVAAAVRSVALTADDTTADERPGHGNETALTGDDAQRATAAALAEVPDGTVLRVETDDEGVYEAHVRRADGTHVVVKMDAAFAVTGVEEHQGRGPGGRHGNETALTGDDAQRATAAALAEVPDGTVLRVETDDEGVYEAHVRKADGTHVVVKMDAAFAVTGVEEHQGHGPGGRHGGTGGTITDDSGTTATPSSLTA